MVQALRLSALALLFASGAAGAQNIPTCTITATPPTGTGATDITVTWSTTNATTCTASGNWSGTKDCAGGSQVFADQTQSRTYTLTVRAATGKVTARWTKPTQNTDGSAATITGYKLFIADSATGLPSATAITLPATPLEYIFWRSPGNVSAGIKAVRSDGANSALSNVASKTVTAAQSQCAATVTIGAAPKAPSLTLSWLKDLFTPERAKQNGS